MPSPLVPYAYAAIAIAMWSTVATAFKLTLRELDPIQMLFYACATSAIALLAVLAVRGRLGELRPALSGQMRTTIIAAALNPTVYYLVLFAAYDRLPAQVAQPINYTWAIVLTFMSMVVLRHAVTRHDLTAALVCYGGVFLIATQGDLTHFAGASLSGLGLALGSTLIWATYWIINMRDPRPPEVGLCLNFLIATPVLGIGCLLFSSLEISLTGLGGAVYIGLFEMSLAFLAWSNALRTARNASRVSNLIFLSPFLSLLLINRFVGEEIYGTTFVGLALIVGGLLFQQFKASGSGQGTGKA